MSGSAEFDNWGLKAGLLFGVTGSITGIKMIVFKNYEKG